MGGGSPSYRRADACIRRPFGATVLDVLLDAVADTDRGPKNASRCFQVDSIVLSRL
jgi:hypothetical protein